MSHVHLIEIKTRRRRGTYVGWAEVIDALLPYVDGGYEVDYLSTFISEWKASSDQDDDLKNRIAGAESVAAHRNDTLALARDGNLVAIGRREVVVALAEAAFGDDPDMEITIETTVKTRYHVPTTGRQWGELPLSGGEPLVHRWERRTSS